MKTKLLKLLVPFSFIMSSYATPQLIGGVRAARTEYKSVVFVNAECTATKIGPRTFIFGAHCVINLSTGQLKDKYKTGSRAFLKLHFENSKRVTIDKVFAHPSYIDLLKSRLSSGKERMDGGGLNSFDISIFTVRELTPTIEISKLNYDYKSEGTKVVVGGFGCEVSNFNPFDSNKTTLKISPSELVNPDTVGTDFYFNAAEDFRDISEVGRYNLITKGTKANPRHASLCYGDSGGPLFQEADQALIGVNSQFIFKDHSGISFYNTHTRFSEIASWIQDALAQE